MSMSISMLKVCLLLCSHFFGDVRPFLRLFLTDLAGPYPGILTGFLSGVFLPSGLYFQKSVKMFRIPFLMIIL